LPAGATLADGKSKDFDCVQLFVENVKQLNRDGPRALKAVKPDGLLWICYPKGTSKVKTDISRDAGWDVVAAAGVEGGGLVAIDETWSAMRFRPTTTQSLAKPDTSDEAVKAATGKVWDEWFAILDKAGCQDMIHKEVAELLVEKHRVRHWWGQMITVGYER